jgi:pimeloyl-ACP methyl ester carboxylesterase
VTYDRRGYSRSKLNNPEEIPSIESHADDAHLLLAKVTSEPARVYGNSAGAVIALDLLARYPEQINKIMISEPAKMLSTDPEDHQMIELGELLKNGGLEAIQQYIGVDFNAKKPVVAGDGITREKNMKFFMEKEPIAVGRYQYKFDALKVAATRTRIFIGGSTTAQEAIGYRGAVLAAKFFNGDMIEFPGDHAGYISYPKEYAEKLHDVLEGEL